MKNNLKELISQIYKHIVAYFTLLSNKITETNDNYKNEKNMQKQCQLNHDKQVLYSTWQLQLQYEMFVAFSTSSSPINLRKLEYVNDLIPLENCILENGTVEYYFLMEKHENHQVLFSRLILKRIIVKLNKVINLCQVRLYNSYYCTDMETQQIIQEMPLTIRGYQIINCQNYKHAPENYIVLTVVIY